ncbi:MAG: hypothetical protein ACTHJ5_13495 [Ilyomonas sp.]
MGKYRVEFVKNEIKSIHLTEQEVPVSDTILEDKTGDTMYVILHADNEQQAREKAQHLQSNLKNRQ